MKTEELEQKIKKLERRVKYLEEWIATHHCTPYPPNIKRVIGKPLEDQWIPDVEV